MLPDFLASPSNMITKEERLGTRLSHVYLLPGLPLLGEVECSGHSHDSEQDKNLHGARDSEAAGKGVYISSHKFTLHIGGTYTASKLN